MKFLFGLLTGVVLGMMYAPAPGQETREELAQKAREWSDLSQKAEQLAEASKEKAGEIGARVGREAAEKAVQAATDKIMGKRKESA